MLNNEEVIQALENGEISIDEALRQLTDERATDGNGLTIGRLVAIQRGNDPATIRCSGDRNVNWGITGKNSEATQIQSTDIFRMYSVTKMLTAHIIMQLVSEAKLKLDNKIIALLPDMLQPLDGSEENKIKLNKDATISDVLMHLSGITNYPDNPDFMTTANANPGKKWTIEETVSYTPPGSKIRGGFAYSDTGYNLLGMIAQKVTGRDYYTLATLAAKNIGLEHTYFYPDIPDCGEVLTQGYAMNPITKLPISHLEVDTSFAAGGMFSSANDMLRLAKLSHQRFLNDPSDQLFVPMQGITPSRHINGPNQGKYAYGVMRQEMVDGNPFYGHGGYGRGGRTKVFYFPKRDTSVVILETYETITPIIAKELAKEQPAYQNVNKTILLLRDAYTDDSGKFNRSDMFAAWKQGIHVVIERIANPASRESRNPLNPATFVVSDNTKSTSSSMGFEVKTTPPLNSETNEKYQQPFAEKIPSRTPEGNREV